MELIKKGEQSLLLLVNRSQYFAPLWWGSHLQFIRMLIQALPIFKNEMCLLLLPFSPPTPAGTNSLRHVLCWLSLNWFLKWTVNYIKCNFIVVGSRRVWGGTFAMGVLVQWLHPGGMYFSWSNPGEFFFPLLPLKKNRCRFTYLEVSSLWWD